MLFPSFKALLINIFLYSGIFVLLFISSTLFNNYALRSLAVVGMIITGLGFAGYGVTNLIKMCGLDFYVMRFFSFITILAAPILCTNDTPNGDVYAPYMTIYAICAYGISAYLYVREMKRRNQLEEAYRTGLNNGAIRVLLPPIHQGKVHLKRPNTPKSPRKLIIPGRLPEQRTPSLQADCK